MYNDVFMRAAYPDRAIIKNKMNYVVLKFVE